MSLPTTLAYILSVLLVKVYLMATYFTSDCVSLILYRNENPKMTKTELHHYNMTVVPVPSG